MANVEIYTKDYCPYCKRAKALFKQKGIGFKEYPIDQKPSLREKMIKRADGGRTVPQIFIDNKHIGGCDDLFALDAQDQLNKYFAE